MAESLVALLSEYWLHVLVGHGTKAFFFFFLTS